MEKTEAGLFRIGKCRIIVSKDAGLWHLSISRKDRLPNYDELKMARYQFMPDVKYAVQIFPPKEDFVNLHSFTLHLWEPKDFIYSELNIND